MPGGGSKFNGQELKDRKMGNFHVLGLEMSKNDLWSAKCAAIGLPGVAGVFIFQLKVEERRLSN
jgi:hypothetical protein